MSVIRQSSGAMHIVVDHDDGSQHAQPTGDIQVALREAFTLDAQHRGTHHIEIVSYTRMVPLAAWPDAWTKAHQEY